MCRFAGCAPDDLRREVDDNATQRPGEVLVDRAVQHTAEYTHVGVFDDLVAGLHGFEATVGEP